MTMKWLLKFILAPLFCILWMNGISQPKYAATGHASYYAAKFDGRKTANGEIFSNKKLTAAHRTLPFGTIVKVTNVKNNKSVVVRINDRGPYAKNRIIDLSHAAADSLGIIHAGWAMVKVEEYIPEPVVVAAALPDPPLFDAYRYRFPDDWTGKWDGMLKIYSPRGLEKNISMQLNILPTDSSNRFTWTIIYDSIPRNYELVIRDTAIQAYSLDEKNGIDIMCNLLGNHFISRFSVQGTLLDCDYELLNRDEMRFKISAGDEERHFTTGNIDHVSDSVPEVGVFKITNLQIATLQRVKE